MTMAKNQHIISGPYGRAASLSAVAQLVLVLTPVSVAATVDRISNDYLHRTTSNGVPRFRFPLRLRKFRFCHGQAQQYGAAGVAGFRYLSTGLCPPR
jgi:hypothetical protein